MKKLWIISLIFLCTHALLVSQNFNMPFQSSAEIFVSSGRIYDNGGPYNLYAFQSKDTLYVHPSEKGNYVKLDFLEVDFEGSGAYLQIYNGNWDEQMGTYTENPGVVYSTDSSGTLILVFHSEKKQRASGFKAVISLLNELPDVNIRIVNSFQSGKVLIGNQLDFSIDIINNEQRSLDNISLDFFISKDTVIDDGDIPLGKCMSNAPTESLSRFTCQQEVPIDTSFTIGNYYLLALFKGSFSEIFLDVEETKYYPIEILYPELDLIAETYSHSKIIESHKNYELSYRLMCKGNMPSPLTKLGFYISKDTELDSTDRLLVSDNLYPVSQNAARAGKCEIQNLDLDSLPSGFYYLIFMLDTENEIKESSEDNNTYVSQIYYNKNEELINNISISELILDDTLYTHSGETEIFAILDLNSDTPIVSMQFGMYLSSDSVFDIESDRLLTSDILLNLKKGKTRATLLTGIKGYGTKYIIFYIDSDDRNFEINEDDNIIIKSVLFTDDRKADMKPEWVNYSADSLLPDQRLDVEFNVWCNAYSSAPFGMAGFYLSEDSIYDYKDKKLGEIGYFSRIPKMDYFNIGSVQPGDYYLIMRVDNLYYYKEYNEKNNFYTRPFHVIDPKSITGIDLGLINSSIQDTLYAGQRDTLFLESYLHAIKDQSVRFSAYLSEDTILDFSEVSAPIFCTNKDISALQNNTDYFSFIVPDIQESKKYFILIKGDSDNLLFEDSESNNILVNEVFLVNKSEQSNLSVSSFLIKERIISAYADIVGDYQIIDLKTDGTDSLFIEISMTSALESNAPEMIVFTDTIVIETPYQFNTFTCKMPEAISEGLYIFTLKASQTGNYYDLNPGNNTLYRSVGVSQERVDLIVDNLNIQTTEHIVPDSFIDFSHDIRNSGPCLASNIRTAYYLSSDECYSSDDLYLSANTVTDIAIGYTMEKDRMVYIGEEVLPGNYYLLVIVDPDSLSAESDETNNVVSSPVIIETDDYNFTVLDFSLDKLSFNNYEMFSISYEVKNTGNISAALTSIRFYFSKDTIVDNADLAVLSEGIPYLGVDKTSRNTSTCRLYSAVEPGEYYIIAFVDFNEERIELNEMDNIKLLKVDVIPYDYDFEWIPNPIVDTLKVTKGSSFIYYHDIRNNGLNAYSGELEISAFISTDSIFELMSDSKIGSWKQNVEYLANSTNKEKISLNIPESINQGDFYYFVQLDPLNSIEESNEDNNSACLPLSVTESDIDLFIGNYHISEDVIRPSDPILLSYSIHNLGETSTETGFYNRLYLSKDTIISPDDIHLFNTEFESLPGLNSMPVDIECSIGDNTISGKYYLLTKIDFTYKVQETNEENNTAFTPVYIQKNHEDLILESCSISDQDYFLGDTLLFNSRVINQSNTVVSDSSIILHFFSEDEYLDSYDYLLDTAYISSLDLGESITESSSTIIPQSFIGEEYYGDYYIIFYMYSRSAVYDQDAVTQAVPITISGLFRSPDLSVIISEKLKEVLRGDTLSVESVIKNIGLAYSNSLRLEYILSEDAILDPADILLDKLNLDSIAPGDSLIQQRDLVLDESLQAGTYMLFLKVIETGTILETEFSNNINYRSFSIASLIYVENPEGTWNVSVYPNPVTDMLTIESECYLKSYRIYNNQGKVFSSNILVQTNPNIDVSFLSSGNYIIEITSIKGSRSVLFIKK